MNIAQIMEVLPLQLHVRRGELVTQSSNPAHLINRACGTSAALPELDGTRPDAKADPAGRQSTSGRSPSAPDAPTRSLEVMPISPGPAETHKRKQCLWRLHSSRNSCGPRSANRARSPTAIPIFSRRFYAIGFFGADRPPCRRQLGHDTTTFASPLENLAGLVHRHVPSKSVYNIPVVRPDQLMQAWRLTIDSFGGRLGRRHIATGVIT
jgi:hypothetical protein